eukprot:NODE_27765_length_501_cov_3.192513.p3 GENE.NODE_27765_length_501_cov_3.192513~~NODE_27765_length_501_cov_3.192513.p3  ORF type:complete len:65 (-),score=14.63 NODE_27765_length_501_cov_3.192513:162-356(-)
MRSLRCTPPLQVQRERHQACEAGTQAGDEDDRLVGSSSARAPDPALRARLAMRAGTPPANSKKH